MSLVPEVRRNTHVHGGGFDIHYPDASVGLGSSTEKFGLGAQCLDDLSTAIGFGAIAASLLSTAIGLNAVANNPSSIAIGANTLVGGTGSIVLGTSSTAGTGSSNIVIGFGNSNDSLGFTQMISNGGVIDNLSIECTAIGDPVSLANTQNSVCIGNFSAIDASHSAVCIGYNAEIRSIRGVAIGRDAFIPLGATNGIAIGFDCQVTGDDAVAIGYIGLAAATSVCVGASSISSINSVAVGYGAIVSGDSGIAIGRQATAAQNSIAIGRDTMATIDSISIGSTSIMGSQRITLLGMNAAVMNPASDSTAVGEQAMIDGTRATQIGAQSSTTANEAIAIGYQATAGANQLRIGSAGAPINDYVIGGGALPPIAGNNAPAANATGLLIIINNGAIVQRTVNIGAANSGGVGQRLLTVAN